jgi:hypothetical protein
MRLASGEGVRALGDIGVGVSRKPSQDGGTSQRSSFIVWAAVSLNP